MRLLFCALFALFGLATAGLYSQFQSACTSELIAAPTYKRKFVTAAFNNYLGCIQDAEQDEEACKFCVKKYQLTEDYVTEVVPCGKGFLEKVSTVEECMKALPIL
ncbi:unnamed protein product, partial [Mesorhabditis spiculigera]